MTKTTKTVIYHSADFDGIFCREIARKFLGDQNVEFIGWNFGDPLIPYPNEGVVYVMDLPPEQPFGRELAVDEKKRVIWIDHHASSLQKYDA